MRIFKSHPLLQLLNSYVIDSSQPTNLSFAWNFGSLLATCLIIQIITGVTLAMHFNPSVSEAFNSVEHIMRDVNNGWLIRYFHSNTASAFFFIVYLHIGRGLYYGSYQRPRTLTWYIGTLIFILMMATAFLGYVLPYGQMSLWGATVITNLMSAIPWVGQDIVEFIWGGFSVNNATLNRFFALHFVLPFVLAALALMHLIALHATAGSNNPTGLSGVYDRLPMAPYFLFKDLITFFLFILVLSIFVYFMPNVLGDSENYVAANPMQTPPAIVPEWYLLPFYAILRSIPNKLLGVIAMFSAILALLAMPFVDLARSRGIQFKPLSKTSFFVFLVNFIILMILGAKHVESPFILFGMISTAVYFLWFINIIPGFSLIENTLLFIRPLVNNLSRMLLNAREAAINNANALLARKVLAGFPSIFILFFVLIVVLNYLFLSWSGLIYIVGLSLLVTPVLFSYNKKSLRKFHLNLKYPRIKRGITMQTSVLNISGSFVCGSLTVLWIAYQATAYYIAMRHLAEIDRQLLTMLQSSESSYMRLSEYYPIVLDNWTSFRETGFFLNRSVSDLAFSQIEDISQSIYLVNFEVQVLLAERVTAIQDLQAINPLYSNDDSAIRLAHDNFISSMKTMWQNRFSYLELYNRPAYIAG